MGRVIFRKGEQRRWIDQILEKSGVCLEDIATMVKVSSRTVRDWRREKFSISDMAVQLWSDKFDLPFPDRIKRVSDYWYAVKGARKGAFRKMELYGPPGTSEGRKKGGTRFANKKKITPRVI